MKNYSANSLAIWVGLILSGVLVSLLVILKFVVGHDIPWLFLLLIVPIFFFVSFVILRNILYNFIYKRIRLIYKSITNVKSDDKSKREKFNLYTDWLKQVDEDVMEWAENSRKEIQEWKHMVEYRKEFLGNVSHELKTPVFNIQGYTLTLLEGGLEDDRINRKFLSKIDSNINRMISIVNDLEAISKLEHGELKLEMVPIDPVEVVKEIIENLEDRASQKGIKMDVTTHYERNLKVKADLERIRQVFTNLILNGVNYGSPNGILKVELFDMDENLLIEVTDDGIGISEEDIPRIFERFYRVDKSRSTKSGGTGLGLSIVKHIIEAHNQTINVRSTIGIGTTIGFTLKKIK
jgi:two-component system phosphate regulon sensor histidine kinase PhoR